MTALRTAAALAAIAAASPAAAQLSNRSIALESGVSRPLGAGGAAAAAFGLAATVWLEGPLEAVARIRYAAGERTRGRGTDGAFAGTVGVRASLLPDPLRPQLGIEVGWARRMGPHGAGSDRLAAAALLGLEWFPARDLSIAVRGGYSSFGRALSAEVSGAVAAYF